MDEDSVPLMNSDAVKRLRPAWKQTLHESDCSDKGCPEHFFHKLLNSKW